MVACSLRTLPCTTKPSLRITTSAAPAESVTPAPATSPMRAASLGERRFLREVLLMAALDPGCIPLLWTRHGPRSSAPESPAGAANASYNSAQHPSRSPVGEECGM